MAKIENSSNGPREIHSLPKEGRPVVKYVITAAKVAEDAKQTLIKGVGEIPDDVLDELLAKDPFTKGLFDDGGGLVRVGVAASASTSDDDAKSKKK